MRIYFHVSIRTVFLLTVKYNNQYTTCCTCILNKFITPSISADCLRCHDQNFLLPSVAIRHVWDTHSATAGG